MRLANILLHNNYLTIILHCFTVYFLNSFINSFFDKNHGPYSKKSYAKKTYALYILLGKCLLKYVSFDGFLKNLFKKVSLYSSQEDLASSFTHDPTPKWWKFLEYSSKLIKAILSSFWVIPMGWKSFSVFSITYVFMDGHGVRSKSPFFWQNDGHYSHPK